MHKDKIGRICDRLLKQAMARNASAYREAGVNISAGEELAARIGKMPSVTASIGDFAAVLDMPAGLADPVILTSCDGVGTKLELLGMTGRLADAGIDLVAMCANDLICLGGKTAYFLDYYCCDRLDVDQAEQIIAGIAQGCELAGCKLAGGETAELPGILASRQLDIAGFAIGFAERAELLGAQRVAAKDEVIALESSGPHSNGYSLIRKIIADAKLDLQMDSINGIKAADCLLAPTVIYARAAQQLQQAGGLKALAHITGGGLAGNLARVLPDGLGAVLEGSAIEPAPIFSWLAQAGNLSVDEMRTVFNCGIGMVAIVDPATTASAIEALDACGQRAWPIGHVVHAQAKVTIR